MIQSMTGFGSAEKGGVKVEVRSLNHRYNEIAIKLPPALIRHEIPLRDMVKKRFERGKFDVHVSTPNHAGLKISINKNALKELLHALDELKGELSLPGAIDMATLLQFRDLYISEETAFEPEALYDALSEALTGLEAMRSKEGETLKEELLKRAGLMESMTEDIAAVAPSIAESLKARLLERLRELLPGSDDSRLLQEASEAARRMDITEEITRLRSHIGQIKAILAEGGAVGRKLDFLLQELNREANTIASKAEDFKVMSIVVDMKAEIEKSREQVQNIQ